MGTQRRLGSSYVLERVVGEGASGQVWVGSDAAGNVRAFKLLRSELATDPGIVNRFVQERTLLASIRHPHVVQVHDLVIEGSTLAIVMDYVEGVDLRTVIRERGSLAPEQVAQWGQHIALALGAAHAKGVVHRDVKPENVLIESSTGQAKLTDFGIAKLVDGAQRSTMLLGTPQYMAPEIAEGRDPSPAADVYSLGVVLYESSCGVPPFAGRGSAMATLRAHALDVPGRPAGVPDSLWDLLSGMLQKDPGHRPGSAQLVAQALAAQQAQFKGVPPAPRLAVPPPPRTTTPFAVPAGAEDVTMVAGAAPSHPGADSGTVVVDRFAGSSPAARQGSSLRSAPSTSVVGGGYVSGAQPPFAASVPLPPAGPSRPKKGFLIGALSALAAVAAFLAVFLLAPRGSTPASTPVTAAPTTPPAAATATPPSPQPTVTVTAPPPPLTVTRTPPPSVAPPAVSPPTQAEAADVVTTYGDRFRSGTLSSADMTTLFTPTVQWYKDTLSRAELYNKLSGIDRTKNTETYDRGVYRGYDSDVGYRGQPSSTIHYYVAYHKPSGSGAVIVHYTVVKTDSGNRIAAVSETPA